MKPIYVLNQSLRSENS